MGTLECQITAPVDVDTLRVVEVRAVATKTGQFFLGVLYSFGCIAQTMESISKAKSSQLQ